MHKTIVLSAVLAVLAVLSAGAFGDDVTIRTIGPDGTPPPASQPGGPKAGPTDFAPAVPAKPIAPKPPVAFGGAWAETGDFRVSVALATVNLTAEQANKITAAVADIRKQITDATKDQQGQQVNLQRDMMAAKDRAERGGPEEVAGGPRPDRGGG